MARLTPDLGGRVALVTGASRGIGAAAARALAEAGCDLVLASRDQAALGRVARDVGLEHRSERRPTGRRPSNSRRNPLGGHRGGLPRPPEVA